MTCSTLVCHTKVTCSCGGSGLWCLEYLSYLIFVILSYLIIALDTAVAVLLQNNASTSKGSRYLFDRKFKISNLVNVRHKRP